MFPFWESNSYVMERSALNQRNGNTSYTINYQMKAGGEMEILANKGFYEARGKMASKG